MNALLSKKILLSTVLALLGYPIINAHASYTLLPSAHDEKVVIRVTEDTPITGFDSQGHSIVLHQYKTKEVYFEPVDAFDLGMRHTHMPIVEDALRKLALQRKTIDMSNALIIIRDSLHEARTSRTVSYWVGGIIGTASVLFSIGTNDYEPLSDRLVRGGVIGGLAGGFFALIGYLGYRNASSFYTRLTQRLMRSSVCRISDRQTTLELLEEIQSLARSGDKIVVAEIMRSITKSNC